MKQGTVSVLIGIHSPMHSLLVLRSWHILYHKWPEPWQVVCIFIHDIGHWGKDYLDNLDEKRLHWYLGARIAYKLFGDKGYKFVAGHDAYSGIPRSELYKPDKYSMYIAPTWLLYWQGFVEPKVRCGLPISVSVHDYQNRVRANVDSGQFNSNHDIYIERRKKNGIS